VGKAEAAPTPAVEATLPPKPEKKPVAVAPRAKKPAKPAAVAPKVKKPVAEKQPKPYERPKRLVKLEPPPAPPPMEETLAPPPAEESMLPPPAVEVSEPAAPPPPPAKVAAPKKEAAPEGALDLDKLFADAEADQLKAPAPAGPAPEAPVEPPVENFAPAPAPAQQKVASLPPPSSGVFDNSKIKRDLFRVETVTVRNDGGVTTVSIEKGPKTKYKIFKMMNPYRIDVELEDVENGLKAQYPAFGGTKVKGIVTQEFRRSGGSMIRVMIQLTAQPVYQLSTQGGTLFLRVP
jgi:hypothetical protein